MTALLLNGLSLYKWRWPQLFFFFLVFIFPLSAFTFQKANAQLKFTDLYAQVRSSPSTQLISAELQREHFVFCFSWIFSFLGAAAIWRLSKNSSNPSKIYFLCRTIACSRSFIVNFSNASFYKGKENINIRFISNSCSFSKSYYLHIITFFIFLSICFFYISL